MSAETPADRARKLLEGTTPGPWRCDQYDVIPARTVSEGWLIADCGTSDSPDAADANARLIAAAPDLARDLIAEAEANERLYDNARTEIGRLREAHEVTRAALADALQAITDAPLAALPVDPEADARAEAWIRDNHAPAQSRRMVDPDQHAAVLAERDEARAELAAAWEETGRPPGRNTLAGAVRWALRGQYSRAELSEILGRREGETTAEAARRVVAERDALQGRWCLACGGTGQGSGPHPCDVCWEGAR